ncbi:MAG: DUF2098 domain-containing protein [Methanolinea sp.]|nr:DUF2098 domain-containing protein [Methanolinea sp.]
MDAEDVVVGMRVRYPRTGTSGRILKMEKRRGDIFAEIDTTHLLYRIDQLVPAEEAGKKVKVEREDNIAQVKRELEAVSEKGFQEALQHSDQSCEGGG